MTLTEFLLARIAEREADAKASLETGYQPPPWGPEDAPDYVPDFYEPPTDDDRARVAYELADCEAKRRIVERAAEMIAEAEASGPHYPPEINDSALAVEADLRDLASIYADHPDYRQEWKP